MAHPYKTATVNELNAALTDMGLFLTSSTAPSPLRRRLPRATPLPSSAFASGARIPRFHVAAERRPDSFDEFDSVIKSLDSSINELLSPTTPSLAASCQAPPTPFFDVPPEPSFKPRSESTVWAQPQTPSVSADFDPQQPTPVLADVWAQSPRFSASFDTTEQTQEDDTDDRVVRSSKPRKTKSRTKLDPESEKRFSAVIDELRETESSYLERLETIMAVSDTSRISLEQVFAEPMAPGSKGRAQLSQAEHSRLFGAVPDMLSLSRKLNGHIRKYQPSRIGRVVRDYVPHMHKRFAAYTIALPECLATLESVSSRTHVRAFLEEQTRDPRTQRLGLASLLMEPVQRMCRLPMLLTQATSSIPPDCEYRSEFERAVDALSRMVVSVNERTRGAEWAATWIPRMKGVSDLEARILCFVRHGEMLVKGKTRHAVLFSDIFILFESVSRWRSSRSATDS